MLVISGCLMMCRYHLLYLLVRTLLLIRSTGVSLLKSSLEVRNGQPEVSAVTPRLGGPRADFGWRRFSEPGQDCRFPSQEMLP